MIQRMQSAAVGVLLEWDEDTESVALALACRTAADREKAYERLIRLQSIMRGLGVSWMDTELSERHRRVCGMSGMALVWRAEMRTDGGARAVARVLGQALGVHE